MIAIVPSGGKNFTSITNCLDSIGETWIISDKTKDLDSADTILLPGVGHASVGYEKLKQSNLIDYLKNTSKTVIGICLGMHLLYDFLEEGEVQGIGVLPGKVQRLNLKTVPHMGWNQLEIRENHYLYDNFNSEYMYFVHSYAAPNNSDVAAYCVEESNKIPAIVEKNNFIGIQFHPEKSGPIGQALLTRILKESL